jgi:DNA-binding GntR family transcriptional regulator
MNDVLSLPEQRSLAADIAERLRAAILSGHFEPGERLREESLAKSMGVSRGPVREAFVRLEREGLIVIRRNRGAIVAQLSREDLDEVYSLRVVLERLAIERAINHGTSDEFDQMQAILDQIETLGTAGIQVDEAAELDVQFHELIYLSARHRRLYETWANLRPQIHILLLNRNVASEDFRDYIVSFHQAILDAMRAGETGRAIALTEEHLRGSYERVLGHDWEAPDFSRDGWSPNGDQRSQ